MRCTWHLKNALKIKYRWAIRAAHELCELEGDWSINMAVPGSPFYPWSFYNARGLLGYLRHLFTVKEPGRKEDFREVSRFINKRLLAGVRVSVVEVAPLLRGEVVYHAMKYYVASQLKKEVEAPEGEEDIYAPIPKWE
tara:strand:+ start:164 stop:577 length:414 start_codon:yes stop_codon:yes gene_type:complete